MVPPTDRTFGEAAGYDVGAPASPEEATNTTPACPEGVTKVLSIDVSVENSPPPQLIDTATTFGCVAA